MAQPSEVLSRKNGPKMHYQGGLVRLNEFFAISFLRKLPRPCEEVKIVGRSLILDPLKGAIVFACLFAVGPSVFAQDDPSAATRCAGS